MRGVNLDSARKKAAWTDYFASKSRLMRLMLWTQKRFLLPKFAKAIEHFIKPGDRVLEAGCGTAMNTLHVCSQTNAEPWALDISHAALNEARGRAKQYGLRLRAALGDIRRIPFCDGSLDVVWNQGVLEHFEDPREVIREMARVGKRVFVAVPRKTFLRGLVQKAKALLGLTADDIFHLYKEQELVELMSQAHRWKEVESGSFNCLAIFSWTWACGVS